MEAGISQFGEEFGHKYINTVISWFDKEYDSPNESANYFDERLFINGKINSSLSPVMSHPFARQGNANLRYAPKKADVDPIRKANHSKRLLKFDSIE